MKPPVVIHLMPKKPRVFHPTPLPTDRRNYTPKQRPNPVAVAQTTLGRRLVEKESGFWLDGGPVSLDAVMRETNRILKSAGVEQITASERWRV